jgi:hypothetical protein
MRGADVGTVLQALRPGLHEDGAAAAPVEEIRGSDAQNAAPLAVYKILRAPSKPVAQDVAAGADEPSEDDPSRSSTRGRSSTRTASDRTAREANAGERRDDDADRKRPRDDRIEAGEDSDTKRPASDDSEEDARAQKPARDDADGDRKGEDAPEPTDEQ